MSVASDDVVLQDGRQCINHTYCKGSSVCVCVCVCVCLESSILSYLSPNSFQWCNRKHYVSCHSQLLASAGLLVARRKCRITQPWDQSICSVNQYCPLFFLLHITCMHVYLVQTMCDPYCSHISQVKNKRFYPIIMYVSSDTACMQLVCA